VGKIVTGVALAFGTLVLALGLQNPLAAADLTASERAAGFRSVDIEVNGANCRFCRINVEQTLSAIPGVKVARADMSRHDARVVYDPSRVQPADLAEALRERPSSLGGQAMSPIPR
jgi:copper chaperone CopZ